ncbi:hypothetical protein FS837_001313, partial [Tulasnella sp. UAMH 9824]
MSADITAVPEPTLSYTSTQARPGTSEGETSPNDTTISILTPDITSPDPVATTISELSQSEIRPLAPLHQAFPSQGIRYTPGISSPLNGGVEERPRAISHRRGSKYLLLFFDGTAKSFCKKTTNITALFGALYKMNDEKQLCYYQSGIGTYVSSNNVMGRIWQPISKVFDMAVACYLRDHILHAYIWLMDNYQPGDKICLFGFSRGAYIARCLAGMLHVVRHDFFVWSKKHGDVDDLYFKVGLLPRGNLEQVRFAYKRYKDSTSDNGVKMAQEFKKIYCRNIDVPIEFIGAWESVTSVGLVGRTLPFTTYSPGIKRFRQALALDERRAMFRYYPWAGAPLGIPAPDASSADHGEGDGQAPGYIKCNYPWRETDWREVWFAGSHNVGGGEVNTSKVKHRNHLANPSLLWMVQQMDDAGLKIEWAQNAFDDNPTLSRYFAYRGPGGEPAHANPEHQKQVQEELEKDVE